MYKFILPVFCCFTAIYGVYYYMTQHEINKCEMTYMFEYPEFLKIPLKPVTQMQFSRYNLYIYGEGKYFEELKTGKVFGVPVLYIPGNAGSHRQVRSLASMALRMGYSMRVPHEFNFFTISFNEEISGLYGGILNDQTNFVKECVIHILGMYSTKKKIILIGHSMGGLIAEAVFSFSDFDSSVISFILTLAAPLKAPVIILDERTAAFYKRVNDTWKYRLKNTLMDVPILSISGGDNDILVRTELAFNEFEHKSNLDICVVTSSIPGVWVSTDHLSITWCKQLTLTICRCFYDLIDHRTQQIITNFDYMEKVLKHHFILRNSGTNFIRLPVVPTQTFPTSGQWIEKETNSWRFSRTKVLSTVYLLIPVSKNDNILIVANGLVKRDWVYGCTELSKSGTKTCSLGENLSDRGEIIPAKNKVTERRMISLNYEALKKYLYLLIFITPVDTQVVIIGERYYANQRLRKLDLPPIAMKFFKSPIRVLSVSLPEQNIFYNVTFTNALGMTEFQVETRLCRAGSVVGQGIIKMHIPSSNENYYYHIRTSMGGLTSIPVKPQFLPPLKSRHEVNLQLILDPECSTVVYAKFPFHLIASQFVKFYGTYIISYSISVILTFFAGQLFDLGSSGRCPSFYEVFGKYPTYVSLVALPTIINNIWLPDLHVLYIPPIDNIGQKDISFFHHLILRTILYLTACGLVIIFYSAINVFLKLACKYWIYIRINALLSISQVPLENERRSRVEVNVVLVIWCALVAAATVGLSCSIGIQLTCLFYLFKLIGCRLRCSAEEERRGESAATSLWYFHFSVFFLLLCTLFLTLPSFVMWLKSFHYTLRTPHDVNSLQCIVIILMSHYFWLLPTPCYYRSHYKLSSHIVLLFAVISTLYGIVSTYRLTYNIAFAFLCLAVCQTSSYVNGISHLD